MNTIGGNTLLCKVTSLTYNSSKTVVSSGAGMVADSFGNSRSNVPGNMASNGISQGYFNEGGDSSNGSYMKDKLSGKI